MKKFIVLLLCVLMVGSCLLVSCNNNPADDTSKSEQSNVSSSEVGYDSESGRYVANLPEFTWDVNNETYATFDVAVYSNEIQTTYFSEDIGYGKYTTTDAVINDAVMERNNYVQQLTGVVVNACYEKDVVSAVTDDISAGSGKYDMAMPFLSGAIALAQEGQLYAFTDENLAQYLDLSMPWWDQGANEVFSISNQTYFATGDITIMAKISTWAITFNKQMYDELFTDEKSLYDIVKDGEWTFDKLVRFAKTATRDNGDGVWDHNDTWGLVSAYSDAYNYYAAAGESIAAKDADDLPYITFDTTRSVTVAQSVLEQFSKTNEWHIYSNKLTTTNIWATSLDIFGEGRALFRTSVFSAIKKLRNYDDGIEFGIVPLPKYDEDQEDYYSPSGDGAYVAVIPVSAKDPEFSAYMTQLVACEAKNYLTPAYYETTLKTRDSRDNESAEMLDDYIFANLKFDVGLIYDFGKAGTMFSELAAQNSFDITSKFDSLRDAIDADIEETIENYRA